MKSPYAYNDHSMHTVIGMLIKIYNGGSDETSSAETFTNAMAATHKCTITVMGDSNSNRYW